MEEGTIKAAALTEYLGVPYQTLNSWIKGGLLGKRLKHPGRGSDRRFYFEDVCIARIMKELLETATATTVAYTVAESLRARELKSADYLLITVLKKDITILDPNAEDYVELSNTEESIIWLEKGEDVLKSNKLPKGKAVIMVPVKEIVREVEQSFPDLLSKDQIQTQKGQQYGKALERQRSSRDDQSKTINDL